MAFDSISIRPIGIPNAAGEFPDACRAVGLSGAGWMLLAAPSGEQPDDEVKPALVQNTHYGRGRGRQGCAHQSD
jgi:hypothetical protein